MNGKGIVGVPLVGLEEVSVIQLVAEAIPGIQVDNIRVLILVVFYESLFYSGGCLEGSICPSHRTAEHGVLRIQSVTLRPLLIGIGYAGRDAQLIAQAYIGTYTKGHTKVFFDVETDSGFGSDAHATSINFSASLNYHYVVCGYLSFGVRAPVLPGIGHANVKAGYLSFNKGTEVVGLLEVQGHCGHINHRHFHTSAHLIGGLAGLDHVEVGSLVTQLLAITPDVGGEPLVIERQFVLAKTMPSVDGTGEFPVRLGFGFVTFANHSYVVAGSLNVEVELVIELVRLLAKSEAGHRIRGLEVTTERHCSHGSAGKCQNQCQGEY